MLPQRLLSLWCIRRKPCTYLAPKLILSPNGPKRDSIWHPSSKSSIGCVQIDFWWYAPCKPCTYLASRLTLSPNRLNWASTWASSPRSTIGCIQNGLSLWFIRRKPCTYVTWKLRLCPNWPKRDTRHLGVPFGVSKLISEHTVCSMQLCTHLASRLALSPNRLNRVPLEPFHLGVPLGASKMVSEPMVH